MYDPEAVVPMEKLEVHIADRDCEYGNLIIEQYDEIKDTYTGSALVEAGISKAEPTMEARLIDEIQSGVTTDKTARVVENLNTFSYETYEKAMRWHNFRVSQMVDFEEQLAAMGRTEELTSIGNVKDSIAFELLDGNHVYIETFAELEEARTLSITRGPEMDDPFDIEWEYAQKRLQKELDTFLKDVKPIMNVQVRSELLPTLEMIMVSKRPGEGYESAKYTLDRFDKPEEPRNKDDEPPIAQYRLEFSKDEIKLLLLTADGSLFSLSTTEILDLATVISELTASNKYTDL